MTKTELCHDAQTILIGSALRGRPDQYQAEINIGRPDSLAEACFEYDLHDGDNDWGSALQRCDALILTSRGLGRQAIERATNLRFVQKLGRSIERVDVDACRARGITVSMLPDAGHVAVAEHTLALLMASLRQLTSSQNAVLNGENPRELKPVITTQTQRYPNWLGLKMDGFRPLSELTLGLIGFGEIAREVAWRARALGMQLLYTKRNPPQGIPDELLGRRVSQEELLGSADIVSIHATLPDGQPPIIGKAELDMMKSDAMLINTARGNQVDQGALFAMLKKGRLGFAALDVFEIEPVPAGHLAGIPNLIVTPHTGANTPMGHRFKGALQNVVAYAHQQPITGKMEAFESGSA
ncbi:MAG TPA: NAD(P)-dependent oxidoreductase [Eoetvoesiella sp.]